MLVACLGDSITEGSPYWDSRRGTGNPEGQWEHWARLAHPELTFANHGIYGQRTHEIARRFDAAVAGADVLIVQGGINDIAQGRPIDKAAANLAGGTPRSCDRRARSGYLASVLSMSFSSDWSPRASWPTSQIITPPNFSARA